MQDWIGLKEAFVTWSGVDRGALQVLGSLLLHVAAAAVLRRPLSSVFPWVAVLLLAVGYEAIGGYADGELHDWELNGSIRDAGLMMALPTLLLLICRFAPRLVHAPPRERPPPLLLPYSAPAAEGIIDAEYEEIK